MRVISNPDGSVSLSRLTYALAWLVVLTKYILADQVLGPFDSGAAASLLTAATAGYGVTRFQQAKYKDTDPRSGKGPAEPEPAQP